MVESRASQDTYFSSSTTVGARLVANSYWMLVFLIASADCHNVVSQFFGYCEGRIDSSSLHSSFAVLTLVSLQSWSLEENKLETERLANPIPVTPCMANVSGIARIVSPKYLRPAHGYCS